ncbi:MAG: hypothetical protein JNM77_12580 [Pseudonocardia sp.]|nr:hypothetical protein [Pseudonocardia sp.]
MTTLTLLTLAFVAYGVISSHGYGRMLALGGATPAGAAAVVGGTAVPTFYAVAIGAAVAVALRLVERSRIAPHSAEPLPPGSPFLLLFLAWSTLVTIVSPIVFNGTTVLLPAVKGPSHLVAGVLTTSNIAQIGYLVLGVCVVIYLARSTSAGPELIGLAAGATTILSLWRYLHALVSVPFPENVFDNSPTFAYIETAVGGAERFRGILSEPASLALSSLVTIAYMLPRAAHVRGLRRAGALFVAAAAAYLGTISTSATFVVGGAVMALVAAATFAGGFLLRRIRVSASVGVVMCLLLIVSLFVLPVVAGFADAAVNEKASSSSFDERSGANSTSYEIFLDTYGIGVGLGANRASSFLAGLLSTTGLVGTLLFASAVVLLIRRGAPVREFRPVAWALVTLLVVKVVSGPDLSDSSGILWMSLGLLARAASLAGGSGGPAVGTPGREHVVTLGTNRVT